MMEIENYFSLGRFAHQNLWKPEEPVWAPLHLLSDYLKKQAFRIEIKVPPGVHLERPELIAIGPGTVIEPGVYIQGPCIIGAGCVLRHGAYLRDGVILGSRVAIGHSAEIKHSILLDEAAATHFTYVGDSIVGGGANLGAGVKCANLRLDRREVAVAGVKTGLKKFGAVIGDSVQIGCNCVLNPGTLVGKESVVYPLLNFGGAIPPRSKIYREGLKNWELSTAETREGPGGPSQCGAAPQVLRPERAVFVSDKGPSEDAQSGVKPTPDKTDFSITSGITGALEKARAP